VFSFIIKIFSILSGILFILSIVFFDYLSTYIIYFIEYNFSNDNNLENINKFSIKLYFAFFVITCFLCSFLSLEKVRLKLFNTFNNFVEINKIKLFLFSDNYTNISHSFFSFTISSILCIFLTLVFLIIGIPDPEGLVENSMATLFLISAVIFLSSTIILIFNKKTFQNRRPYIFTTSFLFIFMLFIFLEEFSYGQYIFNWSVNDFFLTYNSQKEISLHNFFNPLFPLIYPFFGFLILILSLLSWFFSNPIKSRFRCIFEPHPSLIFLVLVMCSFSVRINTEYFEEFFAIFTLFYSARIFLCIQYPTKLI